jgi:hypothetical protein
LFLLLQRVSPVLDFIYEIFSSRSELILQAFVTEMLSLAKKHAAFDQLDAESGSVGGGKQKQEWMQYLDRIFDLINFVLSCKISRFCLFCDLS